MYNGADSLNRASYATGYGKSLIFQCLPIAADTFFRKASLFQYYRSAIDQVRHLKGVGVPAQVPAYTFNFERRGNCCIIVKLQIIRICMGTIFE